MQKVLHNFYLSDGLVDNESIHFGYFFHRVLSVLVILHQVDGAEASLAEMCNFLIFFHFQPNIQFVINKTIQPISSTEFKNC